MEGMEIMEGMEFYALLDRVVDLLRLRGRVSYRALKIQFNLDDNAIEALKDEIVYAQQLGVDEDDRVLVWTGEAAAAPPAPDAPDAERRQLTVMFCDLVDSTPLSEHLDPENLREVVRAYQTACATVIQRFDGHIAQYLGDALLVYFGYPHAHEDDAQRAVQAGLGMLEAMGTLNTRLEQEQGVQLAVRVGTHTGLVVVGEMGGGGRHEQLALGETPNVASRIQGLAAPNTVAISAATHRLVQGFFLCEDLGEQTLKGVSQRMAVYRVLGKSDAQSRIDVVATGGFTPLVGREHEVESLVTRWEHVKNGLGQVVVLSGEGGIGKSRLVQVVKDHVADEPHIRLECRCSPHYQNTAFYPVTEMLQWTWQIQGHDTPDTKLQELETALTQCNLAPQETVPLLAPLLSIPMPADRYPPLPLSPQRQRHQTLEAFLAILLAQAAQQPVLYIVEDLHWIDPSTLELLDLLINKIPTTRVLVLLTCRPTFRPRWIRHSYLTEIALQRLSPQQIEQIIVSLTEGKSLPSKVRRHIVAKTDGVPLFVEELTKMVLETAGLKEVNGTYELTTPLASFAIPATLQDALMARLDRLGSAKGTVQLGATIGRQFSYEILQAISSRDETTLARELERLVEAELVYQQGTPPQATYAFKHPLVQETAYKALLRRTRQGYHRQIAEVLEAQFPETAASQPELLAYHYTAAGRGEPAVAYWQQAGQQANARSAHVEAISHLRQGLALLETLHDMPERTQHELTLHLALGQAYMATKGYAAPEVGQTYTRARQLCHQLEDRAQLFRVLDGLRVFHLVRAECSTAHEIGEELLGLAQQLQDPDLLMDAYTGLGAVLFYRGEFTLARANLEQSMALDAVQPSSTGALQSSMVLCLSLAAWDLWYLGYPDQALMRSQEALKLAEMQSDPFSLVFALHQSARLHQFRREATLTRQRAEAAIRHAREQEFPFYVAIGTIHQGWALVVQGQEEAGVAQIREGMVALRATGAEHQRTQFLALLGEAYARAGQIKAGLHVLAEALNLVVEHEERYCEAELYRLKGELLRDAESSAQSEKWTAEECFQRALDVARSQQAKSLELRAAMSLSRLWRQQGKQAEARQLLAEIYGWFSEGFDTADLQEAKALLDELA